MLVYVVSYVVIIMYIVYVSAEYSAKRWKISALHLSLFLGLKKMHLHKAKLTQKTKKV